MQGRLAEFGISDEQVARPVEFNSTGISALRGFVREIVVLLSAAAAAAR